MQAPDHDGGDAAPAGSWPAIAGRWLQDPGRLWLLGLAAAVLLAALLLWAAVATPPRLLAASLGAVALTGAAVAVALGLRGHRALQERTRTALDRNRAAMERHRTALEAVESAQERGRIAVEQGLDTARLALEQARTALDRDRAALEESRAALDGHRREQAMDRFTRAVQQLGLGGPDRMDARIGAVYALEQLARDAAELHWPIMEVLTAHLREHARAGAVPARPEAAPLVGVLATYLRARGSGGSGRGGSAGAAGAVPTGERTPADVEAIATVLGRRRWTQDPDGRRLDLREVDLRRVRWTGAHLEGAGLGAARLDGAILDEARLEGADLVGAHLPARLREAHLEEAYLVGAHLEGADLSRAQFKGAADLSGADLRGAHLAKAVLSGADLTGANLEDADLRGADLTGATGLTWAQLEHARHVEKARLSDDVLEARPVDPDGVDAPDGSPGRSGRTRR